MSISCRRASTCICSFFLIRPLGCYSKRLKIIDKTNANEPTRREGFWTYKLDTFIRKR